MVEIRMRGGSHPDEEMDAVEHDIATKAWTLFQTDPKWNELGIKKAYNLMHFFTFWGQKSTQNIRLLYRLQPYPEYLEFEVVQGGCPMRCHMCETTYWDEKNIIMDWKHMRHIADQFPNLKWAGINAMGEPNTNKDYFKILKLLSDRGVCQEQYTEAQIIDPKDMEKYVKMGFEYVKFSLDAATPETWRKIRPYADWNKSIEAGKALDYYKQKHHKHWPEIHFHYLITQQTACEAVKFLDVIHDLKIEVSDIYYSRLLHNFKEINNYYTDISPALIQAIQKRANELGMHVSFSQDILKQAPINECTAWTMPYIFPDGTVISCCCMNLQGRRWWQRETKMGNIFEKPFREIWRDKPYTTLRNNLWAKKPNEAHEVCKMCNIYDKTKFSTIGD
jgi:radical SAM protein with 4Fe4S-binding SPASM domain